MAKTSETPAIVPPNNVIAGQKLASFGAGFDSLMVQSAQGWADRLGCRALYEQAKALPCFALSQRVWLDAMRRHCWGGRTEALGSTECSYTWASALVLWLAGGSVRTDDVLQKHSKTIEWAAQRGDEDFFKKLGKTLTQKRNIGHPLSMDILIYWMGGLLWMMTNPDAAVVIGAYTGRRVSEDDYKAELRRLRLRKAFQIRGGELVATRLFRNPESAPIADGSMSRHKVEFVVTVKGASLGLSVPL